MNERLVRIKRNPLNPKNMSVYSYEYINDLMTIYNDDEIYPESKIDFIINPIFEESHKKIALLEKLNSLNNFNENNRVNELINNTHYSLRKIRKIIKKEKENIDNERNELIEKIKEISYNNSIELENYYKEYDLNIDRFVNYRYFSSVVLLIKNENRYLKEWLDWHLDEVGFDHIYIYDNYTKEDGKSVKEYLESISYDKLDRLTINKFSTPKRENKNLQTECYNYHLKKYKEEVKWSAYIDIDEFIQYKDINTFLKSKKEYIDISIPFKEYNANGHKEYNPNILVQERFTNLVDNEEVKSNNFNKDIVQNFKISHFSTHYPKYNSEKHKKYTCTIEEIYYKHFYTKSYEEWIDKINRGSCDKNFLRKYAEFFIYNPDMIDLYKSDLEEFRQSYGKN